MAKKKKKTTQEKLLDFISNNKLVVGVALVLVIVLGFFAYNSYKDWDNAQLIRGLSEDFPALVEEIEQATNLELEQNVNCSITTEKFSEGVRTCELSVAENAPQQTIDFATESIKSSEVPSSVVLSESERTYQIAYRNKSACQISNQNSVYLVCVTAVREANVDLARELFLEN